jgi:acetate kinase
MKPADPCILTINGGSSSIKFALFEADESLRRILEGEMERIGLPEATLRVKERGRQLFAAGDGARSHGGGRRSDALDRGTQRA